MDTPSRFRACLTALSVFAFFLLLASPQWVFAAGTPAGTIITNFATATYKDANGNALPAVSSNKVTTIVAAVAGVDVSPETAAENILAGGKVTYALQITDTGNIPDIYSLSLSGVPAGWSAVLYKDLNGNGVLEAVEEVASNIIDVIALTADQSAPVLLRVTAPASAVNGNVATIRVTATSQTTSTVSDTGTYTTTVTAAVLAVNKVATPNNPKPGEVVTYALRGENAGSSTAFKVVITDVLPSGVTYVPASIRFGTGASVTYDNAAAVTDAADADAGNFSGNTLTFNWGDSPGGQKGAVFFRVTVNSGQAAGKTIANKATIAYESSPGVPGPAFTSTGGSFTVAAKADPAVAFTQNSGTGDPGTKMSYPFTITNNGNKADLFSISTSSSKGFANEIWVDANGDGLTGTGGDFLLTDTNGDGNLDTGSMLPGEVERLVAVVTIPPGSENGAKDITTVRVTSTVDPAVSASGNLTTTVRAPVVSVAKAVTPTGSQPPGQVLTYTITVTNSGQGNATSVVISDAVPANTTYVPSSVTVDGAPRTDVADADAVVVSNRNIVVQIGALGPGGQRTIQFRVTIN